MIKLLLGHQRLLDRMTDGSIRLQQLLESKYIVDMTPLLIAILKKDYATIELLVASGADVKACDADGNTTIIYAAFNSSDAGIPSKESSPAIFQVYLVSYTL